MHGMTKGHIMMKWINEAREERVRQLSLPTLTWREMKSWPDPFGQTIVREVSEPVKKLDFEISEETDVKFVVVRYSDDKAWAGPWVKDGKLFTTMESKMYKFSSREDAERAAELENFGFRVDVFEA
jgi:hypothetical protein